MAKYAFKLITTITILLIVFNNFLFVYLFIYLLTNHILNVS